MSALSIQPPFPIITDTDGSPLENGYVWIGTVNQPAQTSAINVYWDAALTIQATQPIRTTGGYPSRNGSPARLYVNSDYSILVQNKNGSFVYSAPAATERISGDVITGLIEYTPGPDSLFTATTVQAALDQVSDDEDGSSYVGFLPAGTGAVPTTVQAKLRETVSVKDFGAVGDGVTDDTAAIQAAVDYLFANNGNTLFFPDGVYYLNTAVIITFPNQLYNRGIRFVGTSMPGFVSARPGGAKITGASSIEALFILTKTTPTSAGGYSFECENIDFDGNSKGVGSAIVNKLGGAPVRPFNIRSCNFRAFQKAIYSDISATGLTTGICQVNIKDCNFQGNDYALYGKGQSAIMDLRFVGNVCEQNTLGGIYTEYTVNGSLGGSFVISDNLLEGQPNAITINGGLINGEISRNYFEANTGYLMYVSAANARSTVTSKSNFMTNVSGAKAYFSMGSGSCDIQDNFMDAGVLFSCFGVSAKSKFNNNGVLHPSIAYGGFHLDYHCVSAFTDVYPGTLTGGTYVNFGGGATTTPVGSINVTSVSGNSSIVSIGQTFNTGDWIVAMCLMRPAVSTATVYLAALTSVNGGAGNTSAIRIARNGAIGEWVFVCHHVQVTANSGGNGNMRWVTNGAVDIAQTYVYKVASPTLDSTPIYYCLPQ